MMIELHRKKQESEVLGAARGRRQLAEGAEERRPLLVVSSLRQAEGANAEQAGSKMESLRSERQEEEEEAGGGGKEGGPVVRRWGRADHGALPAYRREAKYEEAAEARGGKGHHSFHHYLSVRLDGGREGTQGAKHPSILLLPPLLLFPPRSSPRRSMVEEVAAEGVAQGVNAKRMAQEPHRR